MKGKQAGKELGFLDREMRAHAQDMHTQPIYMRTHSMSIRMHASCMHTHTRPKNPNLETTEQKQKNQESNNPTCSKYKHKVNLD